MISRFAKLCLWMAIVGFASSIQAQGLPLAAHQMPTVIAVPVEAQPGPTFNAEAATKAYLAQIPASAKARSDRYFEGGYWLILWDFLVAALVALIFLNLGISAKIRDIAERITRFKFLQAMLFFAQYAVVAALLTFPMVWYEGFFREHQYGLATQSFGPWLLDQAKDLGLDAVIGGVAIAILFAIVRRLQRTWWIWGSIAALTILTVLSAIGPVFLQPMFNKVTILQDAKITVPILALARANGIPAHDIYQIDASKQTNRMSANVSGFANTMRITLNDNLIRRGSQEEIQAVMGHEMGHYVLNHIPKSLMFFLIVIVTLFAGLRWSLDASLARWGEKWRIRGLTDPAVLPLVFLLASAFFFVLTPVMNTFIRSQEHEADMYGLNASRQPDGFAQAAIHLGEYRKMEPGPMEEILFYDHPSGRARIYAAMRWKAENQELFSSPSTPSTQTAALK